MAVKLQDQFHTFWGMVPVISIKGGQRWLMTSYCKHTLQSQEECWQQLAYKLASKVPDNTLSAQINLLAKQNTQLEFVLTTSLIYRKSLS